MIIDGGCRFVFIGNRFPVLEKLFENKCNVIKIYSVANSFLSRELDSKHIGYDVIPSKKELIAELLELQFDVLVSNGCPYILPISRLKKGNMLFVNVHPSLLPDLKGKNPINGAVLFNRKHGVTCHYMDDGIDTGDIIQQIEIPITEDINLDLLYKISFLAEGEVFEQALHKGFVVQGTNKYDEESIYYSREDQDLIIQREDNLEIIQRRIKAFSTKGLYARIMYNEGTIRLSDCTVIKNPIVYQLYGNKPSFSVIEKYGEKYFLFKAEKTIIQFQTLDYDEIHIGDNLPLRGCV